MPISFEDRSDNSLFEEIGSYASALAEGHELQEEDNSTRDFVLGLNVKEPLFAVGRQLYTRIIQEMYALFCGTAKADRDDRAQLLNASGLTSILARTLITGLIVKYLGIAAALAAVVATLFCRRILIPAGSEVCKFWGENLTI